MNRTKQLRDFVDALMTDASGEQRPANRPATPTPPDAAERPATEAGRELVAIMEHPSWAGAGAEWFLPRIAAIEAQARADALDVDTVAHALTGLLNFRSFIVPRPIGDPAWRTLAEEFIARLATATQSSDDAGEPRICPDCNEPIIKVSHWHEPVRADDATGENR